MVWLSWPLYAHFAKLLKKLVLQGLWLRRWLIDLSVYVVE
jgi:hypothetical protein